MGLFDIERATYIVFECALYDLFTEKLVIPKSGQALIRRNLQRKPVPLSRFKWECTVRAFCTAQGGNACWTHEDSKFVVTCPTHHELNVSDPTN